MNKHAVNDFGILTLATSDDYLKAIGLALSCRLSNKGIPLAVACSPKLFPLLESYFDFLIPEKAGLKGFAHKVYLDQYTPFERTIFLDSDVLVFRSIIESTSAWPDQPYTACGRWKTDGFSAFGLDRKATIQRLGVSELVCIDGAGHAMFKKTQSHAVFERARFVTENYSKFAPGARYADEDVMNIVMTEMGLQPAPYGDFFSRYLSAKKGTVQMDVSESKCQFISVDTGQMFQPCMMHFAADEAPLQYGRQLWRLFSRMNVSRKGVVEMCLGDLYKLKIKSRAHALKKRILLR